MPQTSLAQKNAMPPKNALCIEAIKKALPHRYPFLMIDKIKHIEINKKAIAIKNVTCNEPHFVGHFPEQMIMPGVLIIEAMAQTAAVFMKHSGMFSDKSLFYLTTVESCKFRKPVVPGDVLELHVTLLRKSTKLFKFECTGIVDDAIVANMTFTGYTA